MSGEIFPFAQTTKYTEGSASAAELPMYIDAAWDDDGGSAVLDEHGEPVFVEGLPALRGWIIRALRTRRYAEEHHSWRYGSELDALIGRSWQRDTRLAEAKRYVTECLCQSPYIKSAEVAEIAFTGSTLRMVCHVDTVYGRISLEEAVTVNV